MPAVTVSVVISSHDRPHLRARILRFPAQRDVEAWLLAAASAGAD